MELKTPRGNALFNWGGKIQLIITTLKPDIEIELQKPRVWEINFNFICYYPIKDYQCTNF